MKKDVYELTSSQKNIWELEQINGSGTPINHIFSMLKLKGNLDEKLLDKTLNKIIEQNDSFRLKFIRNGKNIYQYVEEYKYAPIEVKHFYTEDISNAVEEYQNLELSLDNLFRFCIVFTPEHSYVFYKAHHIVTDAWSSTQVAEQIKDFYEKLSKNASPESFEKPSYINFINREQSYINSNKYDLDKQFWSEYVTKLSTTKLFQNNNLQKNAKRYQQPIENSLFDAISLYCANNRITEYSFFLGILSLYFNKIYNSPNIVFGTPFLNRQKRLKELETTGMFVSTLPLMIDVNSEDTFVSLCKKITSTNISLFKHSNFPYHKIQELYYDFSKENTALYEVGFSYQINKQEHSMENNDLGECTWLFSGEQNNPLTIHISTLNNEKVIFYDYCLSCFEENDIKEMNNTFLHLIAEILNSKSNLKDISVLCENDILVLNEINNTGNLDTSNLTVLDIFSGIVSKYSDNIAINFDDLNITYSELDQKTNQLAKILLNLGVTKNTPVALLFDKSVEMIVAILAVLKAGGCYVPILPDEEKARMEYILNDSKPKCILTHKNYDESLLKNLIIVNLDKTDLSGNCIINYNNISSDDIAYIIYTSGSTGNPKGTMIMHKNICSLKLAIENDLTLKATDKDISISLLKYSFDASGIDIYTSLLFGGKLVLVKKEDELNPEKVIRIMEKENVTRSFLIPKWIEHISIQDKLLNADLSSLRILGTGGETLKPYITENLLSKYSNLKILNLYGPTETTMFTTCKIINTYEIKNNHTTIGKPIYGSRIGVINENLEWLPINTKGELIIYEDDSSIKNIAKGYLNLPEQTKNKFINIYNPILNKYVKAYRTGDIVKVNKHSEIEFIGRDDDVVKVNGGYLVALNEVEYKLQKLLGSNFEVYPIAIPHKNTKIIILFLTKREKHISINNIKNYINSNISFYMKPKKIIEIESFPRNSSGKIDRKKLKQIAINYMEENKNKYIGPKTDIEIDIFNYIKELIGTDEFSVTDDLIDDLGIDSLSLTALYTYLEKYNINIQDIYNNPNIKDLSNLIATNTSSEIKPDLKDVSSIKILNNTKKADLSSVLLTGCTGFLGIHILKDLLINNNVKQIYCIIRNKINLSGKKRLTKMIEYYFHSDETLMQLIDKKVIILDGDITKEQLGLDKKSYLEVLQNVTTVINSAANVKHFVKPEQIKKDNVLSVNYLIDFCGTQKTLAHISTLSIAGFKGDLTNNKIFDENTLFINQDFNNNPYLISKFEAEKNILKATNTKNLKAIIFRLGNIMPRASDGVFQFNANQNVFLVSLKAILDSQVVAKDFLSLNLEFSPVDECSNIILNLLENCDSQSIYHILSDKAVTISELKTLLKFLNCDILEVDLKTFIDELSKHADEYSKEYILSNNLNAYTQDLTMQKMKSLGLEWSSIDVSYMQKVLDIIQKLD